MKHLLLLAFLLVSTNALANPKQVIAVVNGKNITRGEVEGSLAEIAEMVDNGKPKLETFPKGFQKSFIDKYIEKLLLVEAARKAGVHKNKEIVQKVKEAEDYLIQQKYLTDMVVKKKTNKRLREIYNENYKNKEAQEKIHASHILVETEKEAKEIREKLEKGSDFDKLALKKSIDPGAKVSAGDLGFFIYEQMVPDFSKAAFALKKGELSQPVKTDFGWHIIKLHDKKTVKPPSFNDAKPALETELARRVIDGEAEKLRKKAKIQYKIDLEEPKKKEEKKPEPKKIKIEKQKEKSDAFSPKKKNAELKAKAKDKEKEKPEEKEKDKEKDKKEDKKEDEKK